jgi:serine acetyltransferase
VIGAVTVGRDAHICGNTVVPMNVPAEATVLGVPGRLVDLRQHAGPADQARDATYVREVGVEQDLVG